jgi:hypothetical protein
MLAFLATNAMANTVRYQQPVIDNGAHVIQVSVQHNYSSECVTNK